jgi:PAS domain S-box-containing protein
LPDPSLITILLVEDEALLARSEADILKQFGYQVITALNGERAVDIASSNPDIDLVLMDIDLGRGMDGTEAAREILLFHDLPVVFLTAHSEQETVEKVKGVTRYGYVIKNSGDFLLQSSLEMAFSLFKAHERAEKMEETLRQVNTRLELALHAAQAGAWDWDLTTGSLEWSEDLFAIFGLNPATANASFDTWNSVIYPDDLEYANENIVQSVNNNTGLDSEYRIQLPDGQIRWINTLGQAMYDENNRAIRMTGICLDITQRKTRPDQESHDHLKASEDIVDYRRAEQALKESEARFRSLAKSAPVGIYLTDANGYCTYVNEFWCNLSGQTIDESKGSGWLQAVFSDDRQEIIQNWRRSVHSNGVWGFEFRLQDKLGRITWGYSTASALFNDQGKIIGHVGCVIDIDERKKADAAIRKLLQEKEVLLREVHHRIKNNMHMVEVLLSMQAQTAGDPVVMHALQDAQSRVHSMMTIYDRLYRSSNFQSISLRDYLSALIDDIAYTWHGNAKQVTLVKEIEDLAIDTKLSYPLGIIINEWLSNSYKYAFTTGGTGTVQVLVHSTNSNQLEVQVSDDGGGLPEEIDINNPEGFGLNLVKIMADQINAAIQVNRSGGTTYRMVIPI